MAYFFSSAEVFWREFVPFFVLYGGIVNLIECWFILQFMDISAKRGRYYVFCLLMNYTLGALCIEFKAVGLVQRGLHFLGLACFTYVIGMLQKRKNLSDSLMVSILIIAVLNLMEGISTPVVHMLINAGSLKNLYFFILSNLLFNVFCVLTTYGVFYAIDHYFMVKSQRGQPYFLVLFIPLTLLILVSQSFFDTGYANQLLIENDHVVSDFKSSHILFIFLLSFACLFTLLFSFKKLTEQVAEHEQKALLERQLLAQEVYIKEANQRYKMTRSFRHDLNNHILVLKGLIENQQGEQAAAYLQNFDEAAGHLNYPSQTGNVAVDALLGDKLALAQQSGIRLYIDVDIPQNAHLKEFDLCVIFANAIDNAVAACDAMQQGEKWLDIKAKKNQGFLLLDFMNSYDKNVKAKKTGGIGLSNIQNVCEKYNGVLQTEAKENTFILTVMLSI